MKQTHFGIALYYIVLIHVCFLQDNVIFERLSEENQLSRDTLSHLEIFAGDGMFVFFIHFMFLFRKIFVELDSVAQNNLECFVFM